MKASPVWLCTPEISPRPASRKAVAGLTLATAWIQPLQQRSGTYTGARNRIRKTGVCISGPAWIERKRNATPAAQP